MPFQSNRNNAPAGNRDAVHDDEVEQGSILWLPTQREAEPRIWIQPYDSYSGRRCRTTSAKIFNHPVVVLSRPSANPNIVHVLLLTSFHRSTIERAISEGRVRDARDYVPFCKAVHVRRLRNDQDYSPLTLVRGDELNRRNYANLSDVYQLHWSDLTRYKSSGYKKLDGPSMQRLLMLSRRRSGYEVGVQHGAPDPSLLAPTARHPRPLALPPPAGRPRVRNYAQAAAPRSGHTGPPRTPQAYPPPPRQHIRMHGLLFAEPVVDDISVSVRVVEALRVTWARGLAVLQRASRCLVRGRRAVAKPAKELVVVVA